MGQEIPLVSPIPSKKLEQVWGEGFKESNIIKGMCMKLGIQFGLKAKTGKEMCKIQKEKEVANAESWMCYKEKWTTANFKSIKKKSSDLAKQWEELRWNWSSVHYVGSVQRDMASKCCLMDTAYMKIPWRN